MFPLGFAAGLGFALVAGFDLGLVVLTLGALRLFTCLDIWVVLS